jgi:thiamine-monophosphate kinase
VPLDELSIIDRFFRPLAGEGAFDLRDDAGLIAVPADSDLVVTTDMVACGIHFLPDDPAETIAQKALRVNISDLAAKGATPLAYTLSLGLPSGVGEPWLTDFADGLARDQRRFAIHLLGGDTIDAPNGPVVSIAAFGLLPKGRMVHRSGGKPGDLLYVSGVIGAGAAGLAILKKERGPWDGLSTDARAALVARFRVPEPRVALSGAIIEFASAAMDISDGLAGDCDKLCAASGCSARIEAGDVPLPSGLDGGDAATLARLLGSGDDYEILLAVSPAKDRRFLEVAAVAGVPVTLIGALIEGSTPAEMLFKGAHLRLSKRAYVHGAGGKESA